MKAFLRNQENHEDVVTISLSREEASQLYWENDSEFRYNGEMYDVLEKKLKESQVIIRCIADEKETGLLNEYQRQNKHRSSGSAVVQLITTQFDLPVDYCIHQPVRIIENRFPDRSSPLQNMVSTVLLPPPDVF